MEGINFMVNEKNEKVAVMIDLKRYSELWEDFYDRLLAYERRNEPRESLESVRKKISGFSKGHSESAYPN